jgi:hypothetical protein
MRRFLVFVILSCAAASAALALLPRQVDGYLAMFSQNDLVNRGVAVTVVGVLLLLLAALQLRLSRLRRELARTRRDLGRRDLGQPPVLLYTYPAPPPWGSRPAR